MIKQLTSRKNLNDAYWQVYHNKVSTGVDRLSVMELQPQLQTHSKRYIQQIEQGPYQVSPIRGVEIPKSNGKIRLLDIPTVVDWVFQQALHQVLQTVFEPDFQQFSFGERIERITLLIRGWINYFRPASIHVKLKKMEEWLRNRLRYCIWHHWKKPERKRKNLIRLGIDQD